MVPEWWAQDLWKSKWWKFSCQKSTNEESPLPLAHYSFPTVILCCLWPLVWPLVWPSLCSVSSICLGCMRELYAPRSPLLVRMVPNFSNSTGDHGLCWPLKACSFHFFSYDLACMRLIFKLIWIFCKTLLLLWVHACGSAWVCLVSDLASMWALCQVGLFDKDYLVMRTIIK